MTLVILIAGQVSSNDPGGAIGSAAPTPAATGCSGSSVRAGAAGHGLPDEPASSVSPEPVCSCAQSTPLSISLS